MYLVKSHTYVSLMVLHYGGQLIKKCIYSYIVIFDPYKRLKEKRQYIKLRLRIKFVCSVCTCVVMCVFVCVHTCTCNYAYVAMCVYMYVPAHVCET